jgi:hypothetical protein
MQRSYTHLELTPDIHASHAHLPSTPPKLPCTCTPLNIPSPSHPPFHTTSTGDPRRRPRVRQRPTTRLQAPRHTALPDGRPHRNAASTAHTLSAQTPMARSVPHGPLSAWHSHTPPRSPIVSSATVCPLSACGMAQCPLTAWHLSSRSHLPFAPYHSHLPFTPPVHTSRSHPCRCCS